MPERAINQDGLLVPIDRQVFLHVSTEQFVTPAYGEAAVSLNPEDFWKTHAVVYYAAQLAIATHRPQYVRDIERASMKQYYRNVAAEKQERRAATYGTKLPDTVLFAGSQWGTDMFLDMAESSRKLAHVPVMSRHEVEAMGAEKPKEYIDSDTGTWVQYVSQAEMDRIHDLFAGIEPYDYLKGYGLDKDLEKIFGGFNGCSKELARWDALRVLKLKPPFDLTEDGTPIDPETRYEARFHTEFFTWIARQDVERRLGELTDRQAQLVDEIATRAVMKVIDTFGSESRARHASGVKEYSHAADMNLIFDKDVNEITDDTPPSSEKISWEPSPLDNGMLSYLDEEMTKGIMDSSKDQ